MQVEDVLNLRQCNKYMKNIIDNPTIIRSTILSKGQESTFSRAVYTCHMDLLEKSMEYMPKISIIKAIVYAIHTKRNKVAMFLIERTQLGKKSSCRCCLLKSEEYCNCICYICCKDFITDDVAFDLNISNLLNLACISDNVEMVKHLMETYNLRWTQFDLTCCIKKGSFNVLTYLCKEKGAKICFNKVVMLLKTLTNNDNYEPLEELLKKNIIRLGTMLSQPLVSMLFTMGSNKYKMVKIIDKYGTKRLLRNILKSAFNQYMNNVAESILEYTSVRVNKKYFTYLNHKNYDNKLKLELLLVNKYELQQRDY
jgi:hypothetical protein